MKSFLTNLSRAALAAAVLTSAAEAATLATPPASTNYPTFGASISCNVLNVGPIQNAVTIEIFDYSGFVVAQGSFVPVPGEAATVSDNTFGAYCKFTVGGGKKRWRAAAVYDNGADYTSTIVAR